MSCNFELAEGACWSQEHVIDPRIDIHAQRALIEMFKRGGQQSAAASGIMFAVKQCRLGGLYLPDQRVPALRAKAAGSGWWKILANNDAVCYREPLTEAPLIVFSKKIATDRQRLVTAIMAGWKSCELPSPPERCYEGEGGASTPQVEQGFRASLEVTVVKWPGNTPAADVDVHVRYGAANVGGERTDASGRAHFQIGWPGYYVISASHPDGHAKDVEVEISQPSSVSATVELLTRKGLQPEQGFLPVCAIGHGEDTHHFLGKSTAKASALRLAKKDANEQLDREVAKARRSIIRTHGVSVKIRETPRTIVVRREDVETESVETVPDSNVVVEIVRCKAEVEACTVIEWFASV